MTIRTATYDAIEYLTLDDSQVEAIGIAYESGDLTELGRLYAAAINRQLSIDSQHRAQYQAGMFGPEFDAQFNALFSRESEAKL